MTANDVKSFTATADSESTGSPVRHAPPPAIAAANAYAQNKVPPEVPDALMPGLKARAARDTGSNEIRIVSVDGIDHEFAMRRPTKKEWDRYLDLAFQASLALQASRDLAADCCLWPEVESMQLITDEKVLPALPMKLCDHLELWAGYSKPRELTLNANTPVQSMLAIGIDPSVAAGWFTQWPRDKFIALTFTTTPKDWDDEDQQDVTIVVRTPSKGVYESFISAFQGTAKAAASYDAAMACCVWPSTTEALRARFADYPGIPAKAADTIAILGGATARSTAKKA